MPPAGTVKTAPRAMMLYVPPFPSVTEPVSSQTETRPHSVSRFQFCSSGSAESTSESASLSSPSSATSRASWVRASNNPNVIPPEAAYRICPPSVRPSVPFAMVMAPSNASMSSVPLPEATMRSPLTVPATFCAMFRLASTLMEPASDTTAALRVMSASVLPFMYHASNRMFPAARTPAPAIPGNCASASPSFTVIDPHSVARRMSPFSDCRSLFASR